MQRISAFIAGFLFSVGLIIGGLANPAKVLGFLDIFGAWDPSLAFVMVGAIAVGLIGFTLAKKRATAILGGPMLLPTKRDIDRRLVMGSIAFGIGWGVAGFCPGPALVLAGILQMKAVVFVIAMLAGMGIFTWLERHAQ